MNLERQQVWIVRSVAFLVFVNGLLALYRPLAERLSERLELLLTPVSIDYAGRSLDLLLGVTLVYFSVQLMQRKRAAWWIAVLVTGFLVISHLTLSRSISAVIVPATGLLALMLTRDYFRSRSELTSIGQGVLIFLASLAVALLYGTVGFWLMHYRDFGINFSLTDALVRSLREYLLIGNTDLQPHTRFARWFLDSLGIAGASSIMFGLYSLFRPLAFRLQALPEERKLMTELLERHSLSSDDYFKLWPHDKSYFFLHGHKAGVAYGVKAGMALAVGDPAGPQALMDDVITEFSELCLDSGWSPAFVYVTGYNLPLFETLGFDLLKVGEDAVVSLATFAGETSRNKHFRNIANRFDKAGYTVQRHRPPHSRELLEAAAEVSREWIDQPDRQEWKFLAGNFSRPYLQECDLFVAYDGDGRMQAFANQIPVYVEGWSTIDLMRHRTEAPSGIMDYLFMALMLQLHEAGYTKFNLGLAPLSGLGGAAGRPEEKILDLIYRSNQKFISLQGLRRFKSKFEPVWEPKYLAYRGGPRRLPRIAYALALIMRAEHSGGVVKFSGNEKS